MKRVIAMALFTFMVMFGLSVQATAKEINPQKVQRLDRKMTQSKARTKRFRTQKEYRNMKHRSRAPQKRKTRTHKKMKDMFGRPSKKKVGKHYTEEDAWFDDSWDYPRGPRQRGYRNFKRGWYLAYRYDRAHFYDNYGYEYGYFNSYGFYFDGIFYGYDRYYRYRDRLRGRGLFDRSYYMPARADRYGFCSTRPVRPYPKPMRQ